MGSSAVVAVAVAVGEALVEARRREVESVAAAHAQEEARNAAVVVRRREEGGSVVVAAVGREERRAVVGMLVSPVEASSTVADLAAVLAGLCGVSP